MSDKDKQNPQERRVKERRPLKIPVGIQHSAGEKTCETLNVSSSGICCLVDHPIPLFTKVQVSLVFPENRKEGLPNTEVLCDGIVVRQEQADEAEKADGGIFFETAIFFQNLDSEAVNEIDRRLHEHEA